MAKQVIPIKDFALGGMSDGKFSGVKNSVYKLVGFDLHSTPRLLKVRQKLTKLATIDEYCKVILPCSNGNTYFFSSVSGKIWKRTSGGTISLEATFATQAPYGTSVIVSAYEFNNTIYYATENRLYGTPVSAPDFTYAYMEYYSLDGMILMDILLNNDLLYTLPTSLSEAAADKYTFVATEKNLVSVGFARHAKGIGNWTAVVHDAGNTEIATVTVANASVASSDSGWFYNFKFASTVQLEVGATYHVHLYVSTGTSQIHTQVASTLASGGVNIHTTSGTYHPMIEQNQTLYIGDKNYVHQLDDEYVFTRKALDLPELYLIKCLGKIGTDLLIGTYIASNITRATLFQWNTWSVSWGNWDDIDEVGINAFLPADNMVFIHAGLYGNIYQWDGMKLNLWKRIEGEYSPTATVTVNPDAAANVEGQTLLGLSYVTGDPVELGVYVLGHHDNKYPYILDLSYPISERSSGALVLSKVEIGAVAVSGTNIFVAWKRTITGTPDTYAYGVDMTDASNKLSGAYLETRCLVVDRFGLTTFANAAVAYENLPASTTIGISTKKNHATSYTALTVVDDVDRKIVKADNSESQDATVLQAKISTTASGNNAPTIEEAQIEVE